MITPKWLRKKRQEDRLRMHYMLYPQRIILPLEPETVPADRLSQYMTGVWRIG